jgi:hypothetical protein
MNLEAFWISFGIGALIALLVSWRFAKTAIHPRFRPHFGVVLMLFLAILGAAAFFALLVSRMVGNNLPPIRKQAPATGILTPKG